MSILHKIIESSDNTLTLWHGGRNLESSYHEFAPHKGGRWEHGPGLYLTNHYDIAARYAKGGNKLYKVTITKGRDSDDVQIPFEDVSEFAKRLIKGRARKEFLEMCQTNMQRRGLSGVPAKVVSTLALNLEAIQNSNTGELRRFLVDHGADYTFVQNYHGGASVYVIHNPKVIQRVEIIKGSDVKSDFELPAQFNEAKEVIDARHLNKEDEVKFWGSSKTSEHIDPADGFYFVYDNGVLILYSTANAIYSTHVTYGHKSREQGLASTAWNKMDGIVTFADKTVKFLKENVGNTYRSRDITNVKQLKNLCRDLTAYGVTEEFKLKGAHNIPKTVGDALKAVDPTDQLMGGKSIVMYHGTSTTRWEIIKKQGLRPGNTPDKYNDLVPGYSEYNIYLATSPTGAAFYGKRQAKKDDDYGYVVLAVNVPDPAKIIGDDRFVNRDTKQASPKMMKYAGREAGEYAYKGTILPNHITLLKSGTLR